MKKKSIGMLMILVLSLIININYVQASVTKNGETWDKECKYKNEKINSSFSLYIKSGKTMIVKYERNVPTNDNPTKYIDKELIVYSNEESEQYFGNKTFNNIYILKNNITANDGKCPNIIYQKKSSTTHNDFVNGNGVKIRYTYKASGSGSEGHILEHSEINIPDLIKPDNDCEVIDPTVQELIDKYLGYIHIIVPIMVIALGTYDFFKAMIASKEDEMKKAQKRFVVRLIAGVLVFLAPTIVNIIITILNGALTSSCK